MKILREIKPELEEYALAIMGFVAIFLAWLAWLGQTEPNRYACWLMLGASGVLEIVLAVKNETLISKWIQPQFRPAVDLVILLIVSLISILWIHYQWVEIIHNHSVYQGWILAVLASHFFFHGD